MTSLPNGRPARASQGTADSAAAAVKNKTRGSIGIYRVYKHSSLAIAQYAPCRLKRMLQPQMVMALLALLFLPGCVRREGRNSACQWTSAQSAVNQRDLSADLEFAEELAIRYMEANSGPRDQPAAARAKNRCLGILLTEIGKEHGLSAEEAFRSFGKRAPLTDLAMNLPFLVLYVLAGDFVIRRLLRRYETSESGMSAILMIVLASVAFGIGGLLLGKLWAGLAETIRVGTAHLSNREFRLPVNQHPILALAIAVALFLAVAVRRISTRRSTLLTGREQR